MSTQTHETDLNIEKSHEKSETKEINKVESYDHFKLTSYCKRILQLLGSKDHIPCSKENQAIVVPEN